MKIGNYILGYGQPTFVIAELCSNVIRHLRELPDIIRTVANTGATSAKIQLFHYSSFPLAEQESKRRVQFPRDRLTEFVELCHKNNLLAGASVFDEGAVDCLEGAGADYIKLAVREWENVNLWQRCLESRLPKIASWEFLKYPELPFAENTLHLACIPQYPTVDGKVPDYSPNDWGWSSHSYPEGNSLDCLIAVSRGACVIERHMAFSETDFEKGHSLFPSEFTVMVKDIRRTERMR